MVTIYAAAMSHSSWNTAWEFIGDCFELVYDADDPLVSVLVLKIKDESGNTAKLYVDGDLFCQAMFFSCEGDFCGTISWQGRSALKQTTMDDFTSGLQSKMSVFVSKKKN